MNSKLMLLPYRVKGFGWAILTVGVAVGTLILLAEMLSYLSESTPALESFTRILENDNVVRILNNAALIGSLAGAVLVGCSKEKFEDEMICVIRLNSLLQAFYLYIVAMCVAALFIYDFAFFYVMMVGLVAMPLLFVIIYRVRLYRLKKSLEDEK